MEAYKAADETPPVWVIQRTVVESAKLTKSVAYRKAIIAKYDGQELPELLRGLA